jgi:hypothetical protein
VGYIVFLAAAAQTLRRLTKSLVQKRGIEKNLFIKKFIKNIIYSSSQIQITLYFSKDSENFDFSFFGGGKQKNREKIRSEFSPVEPDLLVRDNKIGSAFRFNSNCQIPIIIPNIIHACKRKDL